jgi:hypothetical protein
MATDIVGGLFGITPQSYERQQYEQSLREGQSFGTPQGLYASAAQLGRGIAGALGAEDPQLKLISMRNAIFNRADPNDPDSLMAAARELAPFDPQGANAVANQAREAALKLSQVSRNMRERQGLDPVQQIIRSGKYTPESIEKYSMSGTIGDLRAIDKPEKYSAFAQTLIDAGLEPGTEPFIRRMNEYAQSKLEGAKKGSGNVTIGGITIDSGAASKEAGKNIGGKVANIEDQYSLQTAIKDATKLVGQGIYAGAYGPEKGFIAKYSGGMIGDSKKVQNTEVFLANIGEIVIPRLQQFGGNDSNEELKYLQKVVAGEQRLEPESMKRILESAERKTNNNIARLQEQVKTGKTGGDLPLQPMQPAPSAPRVTKRLNPATGKIESVTGE